MELLLSGLQDGAALVWRGEVEAGWEGKGGGRGGCLISSGHGRAGEQNVGT